MTIKTTLKVWGVLNNIMRNGSRNSSYPQYFIDKDVTINNMNNAASGFNNYFANVGPELAKKNR